MQTSLGRRALAVLAGSLVIALAARVAFPLPFTPVPFSMQPLAVLAAGLLLGPVGGALAVLTYLAEGAAGLPVFSPTGPGGLAQLLGPTGGYLLSDPAVAFLAGFGARWLTPRLGPFRAALAACVVAVAVLFAGGAAWLASTLPLRGHALWMAAVAPFLPGELIKAVLAASLFRPSMYRFRASLL